MFGWTLALLLLIAPTAPQPGNTATPQDRKAARSLFRGCELPGQALRYWAVEDTVLDSAKPDGNFGGQSFLECGQGKKVLIRFGDLRRALGAHKRILKASLRLHVTGGTPNPATQIAEVLVPWGEGPAQVVAYAALPATVAAPAWSATWKHRRAGENAIAWQSPGAAGTADTRPIAEARATTPSPEEVRIEGLEAALQRQYERPYEFHGLALSFLSNVEFASSQNRQNRPVLELEVEDAAPPAGPDLAVVGILRTPEYPRYQPVSPRTAEQDGAAVPLPALPANHGQKMWPGNGEEVTYTAIVRNLGDAPAAPFRARWVNRERPGSAFESSATLAPGQEARIQTKLSFRSQHGDHRVQPLGLEIVPAGADADPSNNALTIHEGALAVGVRLHPKAADRIRQSAPWGADQPEEWAQAFLQLWNETIFPQSRFSFAPDGALERLRLQNFSIGEGPLADPNLDVALVLDEGFDPAQPEAVARLLKETGLQLGLADLAKTNFRIGQKKVLLSGLALERGNQDLHPGLMGGGDTRNEGFVPRALILPHEPIVSPIFDALPMETTDLLSATDVGLLNLALGHRRGFVSEALLGLPASLVVRILDDAGNPVRNASVEVYPMAGGEIAGASAMVTLNTGASGTILLPARASHVPEETKTTLGQVVQPNVFGAVDPTGANGMILLKITSGGNADYAYLKAWQVVDAYRRNPLPALVLEVRANVGGDVDRTSNLTENRILTDSANQLPAQLAALLDGNPATAATFSGGKDAWIELDLGRDRVFGEIRLTAKEPFWERFALVAYATGQTPSDAKAIAREASWSWAFANRSDDEGNGFRSVAYRTPGVRARFLRLVRLSDGPPGTLAELKVFPLRGP
jgi:hypothetical protein